MKTKKTPMRMCLGCRTMKPKNELIRVVRTPEGNIMIDTKGKANGRGAYLCKSAECLNKSVKTKALGRALDTVIEQDVFDALEKAIND